MNAERGDDREHQRPAQRGGLHRSASVPARHDGELQRLNAPSLSARADHFSIVKDARRGAGKPRAMAPS